MKVNILNVALLLLPVVAWANPPSVPLPLPGLTDFEMQFFEAGREQWDRSRTLGEGLGPHFNARACGKCHFLHNAGGGYPGSSPLVTALGPLRAQSLDQGALESALPMSDPTEIRRVPQIFGLGLLETIPTSELEAVAAANGGTFRRAQPLYEIPPDPS